MKAKDKTKEQLVEELEVLRQRIAELEASEVRRKQVEERLHESEQNFRALSENANEGILIATGKGAHVYANEQAAKLTGYSVAELLGMNMKELASPDELNKLAQRLRRRLTEEYVPQRYETAIIRKDGERVPIDLVGAKTIWNGQPADIVMIRDITERKRAEERLKRLNLVLRAIRSVNQLIVWGKDRDKLLKGICDRLIETRGYYSAWVAILDDSGRLVTSAETGWGKDFLPLQERLKRGELPHCSRQALGQSEVVVTEDPLPACTDCPLADKHRGGRVMTLRLEHSGKVYGLLSVSIPVDFIVDEEERSLFKEVVTDIAFGLYSIEVEEERKLAEEELRESEEKYRTTFENTGTAMVVLEEDTTISLANHQMEILSGYSKQEIEGKKRWTDFVHQEDLEQMKEYHRKRREPGGEAIPTQYEFRFVDKEGNIKDISLTVDVIPETKKSIASLIDITERKRAEEELKKSLEQVQRTLEGTVYALASTTGKRDPYTADHQRRVTQLACAIAREMNLPEEQINGIHIAAAIHDIGKIYVPAEILSKPGRLSEPEFAIIKTHPQVGYDILKAIEFPWPVAEILLQHHERMDGSGYPRGLSGEDILLEARILGVADVVEAMSSHRPYRPALGIDKALFEILRNKKVLYDPQVVDACLKLFTKKGFKFE